MNLIHDVDYTMYSKHTIKPTYIHNNQGRSPKTNIQDEQYLLIHSQRQYHTQMVHIHIQRQEHTQW
jgi:hypothetical protein